MGSIPVCPNYHKVNGFRASACTSKPSQPCCLCPASVPQGTGERAEINKNKSPTRLDVHQSPAVGRAVAGFGCERGEHIYTGSVTAVYSTPTHRGAARLPAPRISSNSEAGDAVRWEGVDSGPPTGMFSVPTDARRTQKIK